MARQIVGFFLTAITLRAVNVTAVWLSTARIRRIQLPAPVAKHHQVITAGMAIVMAVFVAIAVLPCAVEIRVIGVGIATTARKFGL